MVVGLAVAATVIVAMLYGGIALHGKHPRPSPKGLA